MPDRLIITSNSEIKEVSIPDRPGQPAFLRLLAKIFSFVFHPLFIPLYLTYFIIEVRSYEFAGIDDWGRLTRLLQVFVNCTFLPLVSVLLLRALKFVDSLFLHTQRDRIIPYIISMVFYFWNWYAFKNNYEVNDIVSMSMGIFISSILGFLMNISLKVSMHGIAMGVATAFLSLLAFADSSSLTLYLSITIILSGIVCTSRLIVSDHTSKEIYTGFFIGVVSQLAANYFVYA